MLLQKCSVCGKPFRYKQILLSLLKSYSPVTCRHCAAIHEIGLFSRIFAALLTVISLLLISQWVARSLSLSIAITLMIAIAMIELAFLPFLVRYIKTESVNK